MKEWQSWGWGENGVDHKEPLSHVKEIRINTEGSMGTLIGKLARDVVKCVCLERGSLLQPGKLTGDGPACRKGVHLEHSCRYLWEISSWVEPCSAERIEKVDGFMKYYKSRVDLILIREYGIKKKLRLINILRLMVWANRYWKVSFTKKSE